ncbi:MAG: efflux RND transporter periplasmic adaptor subunit [Phycisphaerae bacterium]|nr:efflux RND transporter periplasmic adaptor subunit [Phycisphaerae bacterium]
MDHSKSWCVLLSAICPAVCVGQMPPSKVVVERAAMRPLPATMRLVGTVEPVVRSVVGSEVAGLAVEMPAREGDLIEAGGVLCRLNADVLSAQLDSARARLGQLQARLDELEAGTRAEELAHLKAAYEEAKAQYDKWASEKKRIERLQQQTQVNEKEVYETEAAYLSAQQRMLSAQAQHEEGVNGPRVEVIAQARFAVAEQTAVAKQAQRDLDKTVIRAPFTGYVVRLETEVGQWVQPGGPIVEMIDLSSVLVTVDAPEKAFRYVQVGDQAHVQIEALEEVFSGLVKHVIPQADVSARAFPVEIEIDNPDGKLKGGMLAWATVTTGPNASVVAVPKDAVDVRRGIPHVCVVMHTEQGTMAMPMPVVTGADIEDWVAITSGNIAPDTQVIVRGNERIMFPMPVVVTNKREEARGNMTN